MNRRTAWLWLFRLSRWALGGFFLYTGIVKAVGLDVSDMSSLNLQGAELFRDEISNYRLGDFYWIIHPTAIILPWLEIVAGLVLISGFWVVESLVIHWVLLIVFNTMIGAAMYRGLDIRCGCGTDSPVGWLKLIENAGLATLGVLALIGCWRARVARRSTVANAPASRPATGAAQSAPDS